MNKVPIGLGGSGNTVQIACKDLTKDNTLPRTTSVPKDFPELLPEIANQDSI